MLIKIAKLIMPQTIRGAAGEWLFRKLCSWEPALRLFLLLLYGKTIKGIRATGSNEALYQYKGQDIISPRSAVFILVEIFLLEVYDKKFKPSGVVVDIGAFVGMFSIKASFSAKEVIAIEPFPETFKMLESNCKNVPNIKLVRKALSSKSGIARLYLAKGAHSHNIIHKSKTYIEVETTTLDDLVDKPVDYIKIDAEGAEVEILKGAERTLSYPGTKLVIAAYHTLANDELELPHIITHLEARNYKVSVDKGKGILYAEKQ